MAYTLLREHPKNPLDTKEREVLGLFRSGRSPFTTYTYSFENLERKVRVYEALIRLGPDLWPFPNESVHSYKVAVATELRRRADREARPYRIVSWLLVVIGVLAAVAGSIYAWLSVGQPELLFALAVASGGVGGFKLAQLHHRRLIGEEQFIWKRFDLVSCPGSVPPSFIDTVSTVHVVLPSAYFEVESLAGGRCQFLTLVWRDRKYRLQEWNDLGK